jgi:hypothetical protein
MDRPSRTALFSRRDILTSAASGLGAFALGSLLAADGLAETQGAGTRPGHHPARARSAIFIFLAGGPSQVDLFDPKPLLLEHEGRPLPDSLTRGKQFAFISPRAKLKPSRYAFSRHGASGMTFSELVPHMATCADDFTMVRSMQTDSFNHLPGHFLMSTGVRQFGRPSVGAWVIYGLGSEASELPGYVVLTSGPVRGGGANWSNGFLPPRYQGVRLNSEGDPVPNLTPPPGISEPVQRASLDAIGQLNRLRGNLTHDPEIASRISSYEMAFRMQSAAPALFETAAESARTLEEYGVDRDFSDIGPSAQRENARELAASFARNCLLARRMVERGVRFVTIFHGDWDHHNGLKYGLAQNCRVVDQPIAALICDLRRRGLLESTLVVVSGEFGRTCLAQGEDGRDHHPYAFTALLAGGGVRGGTTYGASDDFGFEVVENPVHVHDLHATMLHLFGLDHLRLTYRYQGRDMRLTDVAGKVVEGILA